MSTAGGSLAIASGREVKPDVICAGAGSDPHGVATEFTVSSVANA